ncbi:MAG: hypothetical protein P1V18_05555 [Candidatus Gracilibacteria bacterium]|nr:hypothetical protein [Candidatus Gracilibacteria bacterium]
MNISKISTLLVISLLLIGCTGKPTTIPPPGYTVIPECIEDCKQATSLIKSIDSCIEKCYEIHYPP